MVYSCKLSYLGQSQTSCGKGEKEAETIFACSTLEVASLKSFGLSPGAADFFRRKFLSTAEERLGYISYIIVNKLSTIDVLVLQCNQISYLIWTRED